MKKKTSIVSQPGKTETTALQPLAAQPQDQNKYHEHKHYDYHTHGRAHKFPFGGSHGPLCF